MEESDFRMLDGRSAAGAEVPATVRTRASPETSDGQSRRTPQVGTMTVAEVDKDTLCPICMQTITHAFLTACGHSFCYICIFTHLRRKRDCPCCGHYLTDNHIFPNLLLDKLIKKISAGEVARTAPLVELFRQALQQGCEIPIKELDGLLSVLAEKKRKMEQREEESNMQILRDFLQCLRNLKLDELNEIQTDLQCIKEDINAVETQRTKLYKAKERCSIKPMMLDALTAASPCPLLLDEHNHGVFSNTRYIEGGSAKTVNENADSTSQASSHGLITASKRRLHSQFNDLKECYLQKRRHGNGRLNKQEKEEICTTTNEGYSPALGDFQSILTAFTQYSQLRVVAELRHGDLFHSANIVSSIEFDRDDELFATAGVSRRIKIFEFSSVVNEPTDVHYPIVEMPTRTKLSCLSWNKFTKTHIASCDYEGIVTVWDVATSQSMMEYEEHEKRAWSLDFSCSEPSMLVSGSDDCKVKVWCTRQEASALSIDMKANICSVKYNPESSIYLAVGSADHHIHYYDLRNISQPLHVFKGHKKAVSYVKFLSNNELASASTDCTLRLWDVKENIPLRTFRGHTNEKNFVGLSVNSDYLACGSETNEVFVYHKAISKPAAWHGFGSDVNNADDNGATYFTSAVCWKNDSPTMLAANSQGTIKVLVLAT